MTANNFLTLIKCGCITGILWSLSQMVMVITVNELGILSQANLQEISGNWYFLLDTVSGVLAISFYAVLRAFKVSIPRAMIVTVFVWLFINTVTGLKGGGFELSLALATLTSLLSVIVMSLCLLGGVWPYEVISNAQKNTAPNLS